MGRIGFEDPSGEYIEIVKFLQRYGQETLGETISISDVLRSALDFALERPEDVQFHTHSDIEVR